MIATLWKSCVLTLRQLPEPSLRGPVLKGAALALALLALLAVGFGGAALVASMVLGWFGVAWGGADYLRLLLLAYVPMASLGVGFFIDPVAGAVERKHYPDAPPARPRPMLVDLSMAARYALIAAAVNIPLAPLYWAAPPIPALINGYLLGREYFELAARRRFTALQTVRLRWNARGSIWGAGALLAVMATVPGLNLLTPVFGAALMTHILHGTKGAALAT